jgi:hypothetical protein
MPAPLTAATTAALMIGVIPPPVSGLASTWRPVAAVRTDYPNFADAVGRVVACQGPL